MSAAEKAKGRVEPAQCTPQSTYSETHSTDLREAIKSALLSGRDVRLIDFPPERRPAAVGHIAELRDELPIRANWQTIRESHLSQTRLRAVRYSIPAGFLREGEQ